MSPSDIAEVLNMPVHDVRRARTPSLTDVNQWTEKDNTGSIEEDSRAQRARRFEELQPSCEELLRERFSPAGSERPPDDGDFYPDELGGGRIPSANDLCPMCLSLPGDCESWCEMARFDR
jgi:hypothetical protein